MSDVPGRTYFSKLSNQTGFKSDALEKVYRLMMILDRLQDFPELAGNLALKGGTAIQGLVFGFKRLSVDIDLNYVGNIEKEAMQNDREEIRKTLLLLFRDLGYVADRPVSMYAEEQFNIHFKNCGGGADRLKLEINYLERLPVAGTLRNRLSYPFDDLDSMDVLSYRPEELFAGKMRALIVRGAPRDIYDADLIARSIHNLDQSLFRKTALFYLSMYGNVRNMNADNIENVTQVDIRNNLVPMLSRDDQIDMNAMKGNAMTVARGLLKLSDTEERFFDTMYLGRTLNQDLLFENEPVHKRLAQHPAIVWRLQQLNRKG